MAEWDINKPLGECCGSGRKIEAGEQYVGALVETQDGLVRRDFCVEFWDNESPQVFCYWKTKLPNPDEKKKIFIDDDMLMAFFERLAKETDQEKINFRFVLALILMRKRRLKYDGTKNEADKEIWQLRIVGTKDSTDVINPHLDEEQIEQLSSQIGQILHADMGGEM
ncbi:MAG: hypothetical protein JW837_01795 [Sedimentisphaerales bacterium]|nr:hypothetical protein [Sedimentisphaerales bacterium]